jgi:Fe-S-cluster containining protein
VLVKGGDRRLLQVVDAITAEAATAAGAHLVCRPGCSPCCVGVLPISQLDAWRLREGLAHLASDDPGRAGAVRRRAAAAAAVQAQGFPGDAAGTLDGDEAREASFCERLSAQPCPALDPARQTCDLYAWRPMACRTFGPPMRIGGEDRAPCTLCFTRASAAEVERARRELDVTEQEDELTEALERQTGRHGLTTIAFALTAR